MGVTREQHEAIMASLAQGVDDPIAGLFGPESLTWQLGKESVVFMGGGRAALMQAAHPFVAQAIVEHSASETDMAGRFARTFMHVFDMVFGTRDDALAAARHVYQVHTYIHGTLPEAVGRFPAGTRYDANDEGALVWVMATLVHSSVAVHELIFGPLSRETKDAFVQEGPRFGGLFGVSPDAIPPDWGAYEAYVEHMITSQTLAVGTAAARIRDFLFRSARPSMQPLWDMYRVVSIGLLPPALREAFEFPWGRAERIGYEAALRTVRRTYRRIPRRLRYLPAYVAATRRLEGREGPDRYGELVTRAILASLKPARGRA